jgi:hypothetical protein
MKVISTVCLLAIQANFVFSKVIPGPPPPPKPPKLPKPPKPVKGGCGVSGCDSDMFKTNVANFAYHVPNLNQLSSTAWATVVNPVTSNKIETLDTVSGTINIVKYGGFCAGGQKQAFFKGSFVPVGVPNPSWVTNIPAGDLDVNGNFKIGSYKIDITATDLLTLNEAAKSCQNICKSNVGCKYASYGWEAPAGWFCKIWTSAVCIDTSNNWWRPAPPTVSVVSGQLPPPTTGLGGGCRITDTIAKTTALLNPGVSLSISPATPYLETLPYLNAASYTALDGIVASIKCDITEAGTTPGWPTFGVAWI